MYQLNKELGAILNSKQKFLEMSFKYSNNKNDRKEYILKFSIGDPVICTENGSYQCHNEEPFNISKKVKLSNGSEGIIKKFILDDNQMNIVMTFNDNDIIVPVIKVRGSEKVYTIKNFMLAYCITVHKAQGSEWKSITTILK